MAHNTTKPSIYPPYCFDAAPTYNVSSFLRITDISSLQLYRNIPGAHFYGNLPVRWVRIVGIIVAIDDYPGKRVYTIDDSSGLNIDCVLVLEPHPENTSKVLAPGPLIPPEYSEFDVGHVVDLRGPIIPYRRQKAIKIRRMKRVPTTQHELLLWERRLKFRTEVLDVPWVLPDEEIRKYRRKAERADATVGKRKRKAQREDVQGAGGNDDDPFKIRKRVSKLPETRSHKPSHRSRECPDGTMATTHEKPTTTSRPEADPHGCGDKLDPYSIKATEATRPTLSAVSRPSPNRRLIIQDDPFRITKRGSRKAVKPPIQPPTRPSVVPVASQAPSFSSISQPESAPKSKTSSDSQGSPRPEQHDSTGNPGSSKPSQREQSAPAPKPKTQRATPVDTADDPYVIKTRYSRRTLAKPTMSERNTSADRFKITRSRKGPCSEKSPNAELGCPSKSNHTSVGKDSKRSQGHGGFRMRTDADDPFRIRKRARK